MRRRKNEEAPLEVIIGDFHTALSNHSTPQHELVRELGDLSVKRVEKAGNLPGIIDGCLHCLSVPHDVLKALKRLSGEVRGSCKTC